METFTVFYYFLVNHFLINNSALTVVLAFPFLPPAPEAYVFLFFLLIWQRPPHYIKQFQVSQGDRVLLKEQRSLCLSLPL